MANGIRSASCPHNHSSKSGRSSGCTDYNHSGRSKGSSSRNDHRISGASSRGAQPNEIGRQWRQSGRDNGGFPSSEVQPMSDCDDDDDEPRSPPSRTRILNYSSHSSSFINQGGVLMQTAQHLHLTDNFSVRTPSPFSS
jgi:hypothetical protein